MSFVLKVCVNIIDIEGPCLLTSITLYVCTLMLQLVVTRCDILILFMYIILVLFCLKDPYCIFVFTSVVRLIKVPIHEPYRVH